VILNDLLHAALTQLETDNTAIDEQMNKTLKNSLSEQLAELMTDLDDCFAKIIRNLSNNAKGRDEA